MMNYDDQTSGNYDGDEYDENEEYKFNFSDDIDPEIIKELMSKFKRLTASTSIFDSITIHGNVLSVDDMNSLTDYCIKNPDILSKYSEEKSKDVIEYDEWLAIIENEKIRMITDSPETCKLTPDYITRIQSSAMDMFPKVYAEYKELLAKIAEALDEPDNMENAAIHFVDYLWKFKMRNNKYDVLVDLVQLYLKMWSLSFAIKEELYSDGASDETEISKRNIHPITEEEIKSFNPDDILRNL